jgi:hypothetical protein
LGAKAAKKSAKCVSFRLFSGLAKTKSNAIDQRFFATNVSSDDGRLVWGRVFGRESCEKIGELRLSWLIFGMISKAKSGAIDRRFLATNASSEDGKY